MGLDAYPNYEEVLDGIRKYSKHGQIIDATLEAHKLENV